MQRLANAGQADMGAADSEMERYYDLLRSQFKGRKISDIDYMTLTSKLEIGTMGDTTSEDRSLEAFFSTAMKLGTPPACVERILQDYFRGLAHKETKVPKLVEQSSRDLRKKLGKLFDQVDINGYHGTESIETTEGTIEYMTSMRDNKLLIEAYTTGEKETKRIMHVEIWGKDMPHTQSRVKWSTAKKLMVGLTYPVSLPLVFIGHICAGVIESVDSSNEFYYHPDYEEYRRTGKVLHDMVEHPMAIMYMKARNAISGMNGMHLEKTIRIDDLPIEQYIAGIAASYDSNRKEAKLKQAALKNIEEAVRKDSEELSQYLKNGF